MDMYIDALMGGWLGGWIDSSISNVLLFMIVVYIPRKNMLGLSSDYAQPITGQVTEVTYPVIGRAQPELTPGKRQKTGPGGGGGRVSMFYRKHMHSLHK